MRLNDKVAIIVGAGQTPGMTIGNGRATARLFAREGARLLLVDVNREAVEETRDMVAAEGGHAEIFRADITKSDDCAAFAEVCVAEYGRIDILHNNVGVLDANLKGMFLSCKHVLPVMREQRAGAIVNISSTAALWSGDPYIAYNTSKAGVNGLTQALVIECARYGIRVNAIMPGMIETPMGVDATAATKGIDRGELVERRNAMIPLGAKLGEAWDVAYAALFLASDEAKFITGAILPVDGGQLLQRG
jgi:NAD(P)-dependent dehydrogenase (short-subunit alcohol dehydrogenase family)